MNFKNIAKTILILITVWVGLMFWMQGSKTHTVSAQGGAAIYRQHCASCHGGDGKANTARGKRKGATDLTRSNIGNAQGIKIITNGRDSMPGFGDILTTAQIREVMGFIRGFRQ